MTIHGLHPAGAALAGGVRSVSLDGLFASERPDAPWPFYAWTQQGAAGPSAHRASFSVALDRHPRFGLAVELLTASGRDRAAAVFGTGSGAGLAKLRPGAYLVAVGHDAWNRRRRLPAAGDGAWASLSSVVVTIAPSAA